MTIGEKLEILIKRKKLKKTEFAEMCGITYRAFANYRVGARKPRKAVLVKMAAVLEVEPEFLTDENRKLVLTSTERFAVNATSDEKSVAEACKLLEKAGDVFTSEGLTKTDMLTLFSCISEIYFSAKAK